MMVLIDLTKGALIRGPYTYLLLSIGTGALLRAWYGITSGCNLVKSLPANIYWQYTFPHSRLFASAYAGLSGKRASNVYLQNTLA